MGFAVYVILYFPRKAEPFEINQTNQSKSILIATQDSDFKEKLVKRLCDSMKGSSIHLS